MVQQPFFVVFEGIDGSGKGLMLSKAVEYLEGKGLKVVSTFEPTQGKFGAKAKLLQRTEKNPLANARKCLELYVEDRKDHLEKTIEPALKKGKNVLSDRFKYSTIVYQSCQGIPVKEILKLHKGTLVPNLTLIFDLPVETALQRIHSDSRRIQLEKFEKKTFMEKLRKGFIDLKKLLQRENIEFIDASKSVEEVWLQVRKKLDELFNFNLST